MDVPVVNYLMADEHGNPNTAPVYQEVVEALFALAYAIKFKVKCVDEAPTIARLYAYTTDRGYRLEGKHHEIYLSDPRKSSPAKMKAVLRQPVRL